MNEILKTIVVAVMVATVLMLAIVVASRLGAEGVERYNECRASYTAVECDSL